MTFGQHAPQMIFNQEDKTLKSDETKSSTRQASIYSVVDIGASLQKGNLRPTMVVAATMNIEED